MNPTFLTPQDWQDYELLDSGEELKLERFGKYIFSRPEPKALWKKTNPQLWQETHAFYRRNSQGGGKWEYKKQTPPTWKISWKDLTFVIKPTGFKHMGVFPEQAALWKDIRNSITQTKRPIKVLNLFGYTGGSTLAAASAGAQVTHVDASKEVVTWARENAQASGLADKPIRWIVDDAVKFVRREVKRQSYYDAIIMDPPKFGRGSDGQVWKIEEDLPKLMQLCKEVLSKKPLVFILNAYTTDYSSLTLYNLMNQTMSLFPGKTDHGELILIQKKDENPLSTGIFARWKTSI